MTDGPPEAYIRCIPIAELSSRSAEGSQQRRCAVCDVAVWLEPALVVEVMAQHPDCEIVIHCRTCLVPIEETDIEFSPGQVRRLRAQGATDDEIAELFALAKVGGPSGDLDTTRLRVLRAMPDGPEARAFKQALEETRAYVALTLP